MRGAGCLEQAHGAGCGAGGLCRWTLLASDRCKRSSPGRNFPQPRGSDWARSAGGRRGRPVTPVPSGGARRLHRGALPLGVSPLGTRGKRCRGLEPRWPAEPVSPSLVTGPPLPGMSVPRRARRRQQLALLRPGALGGAAGPGLRSCRSAWRGSVTALRAGRGPGGPARRPPAPRSLLQALCTKTARAPVTRGTGQPPSGLGAPPSSATQPEPGGGVHASSRW